MKSNTFVSFKKLETINAPAGHLIEGYNIKGYLFDDVSVGQCIRIYRTERNGEKVDGLFESSRVASIDGDIITTNNSRWEIKVLTNE